MTLRRFTPAGVAHLREFLTQLKVDRTIAAPMHLVTDDGLTELISPLTDCPDTTFSNRLDAAKYLDGVLTAAGLGDAFDDIGLWAWLALRFFDQLRPLGPGVSIKQLGVDEARFIPSDDYKVRHRHLLRHPLQIYRLVERDESQAMCFLVQKVHQPGDFIEQFASRQLYMRNKELLATLTKLAVDPINNKIKRNASSEARRLEDVLDQFDCTWDLGFIPRDLLISMLPAEFEQFRKRGSR